MKHTPGPWRVSEREWDYLHPKREILCDSENKVTYHLADVVYPTSTRDTAGADERLANARLIAAAPEMVEALKEAVELGKQYIKECGPCDHAVNICVCGLISQVESWAEIVKKAEGAK